MHNHVKKQSMVTAMKASVAKSRGQRAKHGYSKEHLSSNTAWSKGKAWLQQRTLK